MPRRSSFERSLAKANSLNLTNLPRKSSSKRRYRKRKFTSERLDKLLRQFNSKLILRKFKRKNRSDVRINKDQSRAKVENTQKLEFVKEDAVPYEECVKRELFSFSLQLLIALTASYGYVAYSGYLKLSLFLLFFTIYAYHVHLASEFRVKIQYCAQLIQERSERQMAFFKRMNASQLVKLDSNEQIDERARWLNDLLFIFWPYINCLLQKEVDRQGFAKNGVNIGYGHIIYFENFTLGDRPPVISSIAVNKQGCRNDELVIDMKTLYSGNCLLSFSKQTLIFFRMNAGVKDIYFRCNARLTLRPLMNQAPYFGGYSFHLLDKPIVDYEGINFANLADNQLFKNYLVNQIAARVVIPNYIYFNMFDEEEVIRKIKQPIPIGLCFLQIIEAENLPMMDQRAFFLPGSLNPFCSMCIGGSKFDTPVVYRELNPYWFTTHSAAVHDLYDLVKIDLYDKDTLKSDFIGSVEFILRDVASDINFNGVDKWLPISRSKTGNLHFRVAYFELTTEITKLVLSNLNEKMQRSIVKFPLGLFSLYIYELTLNELLYKDKLMPLIQIRFNGATYQTLPIDRKKGSRSFFVEECYQFATSNPNQDVIEFVVLDVSGFNLAKLVSVDMLSQKIIGNCAISLSTILNKIIFVKEQKQGDDFKEDKTVKTNSRYLSNEGGFVQRIELFTSHSHKKRRRLVGYMKVFVCLSLCKLDPTVYENLQQRLHVKTNPDQLTSDTSFLKRMLSQPTNSLMSPLRTLHNIKLAAFAESLHEVNVAVMDDVAILPMDLDQDSCYVKLRFFWPERKRIFIEVLRVINVPKNFLLKHLKYSLSVSLGHSKFKSGELQWIEGVNSAGNDKKGTAKRRAFEPSHFIKRTSKLKYNFSLNAIIFNQRLAFDLNPQLHIEDYLISIQLNAHSVKFGLGSALTDRIVSTQVQLPSIIFRFEPLERWVPLAADKEA